jgi:prepilin-type N-terminal cleavage/methylation domain-containing protein/prepilin-type processing-associated H-X9-DG protein
MRSHNVTSRRGFTLVELLVVIGIIALLISILLPTLARARDSAKAVKCGSNARQLVQGLIGYSTDFQGTLPLGYAPIGFGNVYAYGTPVLPPLQRTMEGWVYSVSGYLNPARQNGYTMPWTAQAYINTDEQDNNHPVLYCPQVSTDFDGQWTHYGINQTLMPDWWFDTNIGMLVVTTHGPMNMSQMYGDNAMLWDGQQLRWASSPQVSRYGTSIWLFPSFAFQGIDFSGTSYWPIPVRDWDRMYRNDEGEDPSLTGDFWRSSEYPVMLNTQNLGRYWYGATYEYLRGQEDLVMPGNVFDTDLAYAPIFRHNGQTRCQTGFVDGSVRGLTWNPKDVHPALPGGPYSVGDFDRTMLRPKWPSPLPKPRP